MKVITKHIQARLATPTKYKDAKYKMMTIIDEQALELSHTIKGTKNRFKAFRAKYWPLKHPNQFANFLSQKNLS